MSNYYNRNYFNSAIFDYDYKPIAEAIVETYKPASVIEFGCGNGELSKALALHGIDIVAIDGYAVPDFGQQKNIQFFKVDLNNPAEINVFLQQQNRQFDVAISMEVAEHLNPSVSEALVAAMTSCAGTVVFSAAIPEQGGDGHINCQTRTFWNNLFESRHFYLKDRIREKIRNHQRVGRWYQLNTCDYQKIDNGPTIEQYKQIVHNLVASESAASSFYYQSNRKYELLRHWLRLDIIAGAFNLRNFFKRLAGRPALKETEK